MPTSSPWHLTHPRRTNRSGFVRVLGSVKITFITRYVKSFQPPYQNDHDRTVLEIFIVLRPSSIPYRRRQRRLGIASFIFRRGHRRMYTLVLAPSRWSHPYPQFRAHQAENLLKRVTRFLLLLPTSSRASLEKSYQHARDKDPPGMECW